MKVTELIEQLAQCGPDTEVRVGWSTLAFPLQRVEPDAFVGTADGTTQITLLISNPPPSQTEFDRVLMERDQALRDAQVLIAANTKLNEESQRWVARMKVLQDRLSRILGIAEGRE